MANNNQQLVFSITGNTSGLTQSLSNASSQLQTFGTQTGGVVGNVGKQFSRLAANALTLSTGLMGVASIGAIAATTLVGLTMASNAYVREINQITTNTGVSVESLQQLEKAFYGTGLSMEKFGDINKDTLDKLGDAFRNGGSVADDLKEYGLSLQTYNKFLNQTDGGLKAVIHTFYEMQKAGKSNAEITNVMETLASDSSHLVSTLKEHSNEQDALNYINSQNITLTNESAEKYKEFDRQLDQLTGTTKLLMAEGLTPLIGGMNALVASVTERPKEMGFFNELNDRIRESTGSLQDMIDIWQQLRQVGNLNYMGAGFETGSMDNGSKDPVQKSIDSVREKAIQLKNDISNAIAEATAPTGGWVNKDKLASDAKAAAAKAEALAKAMAAKRLQAETTLNQTLAQIANSEAAKKIKQFNYQQDQIEKKIRESAVTLQLSEQQTSEYLNAQYLSRASSFKTMIDSMITESDPKKLQENLAAIGDKLNPEQLGLVKKTQDERIGINQPDSDNPFDKRNNELAIANLQKQMNDELVLNNQLFVAKLQGEDEYQKRKAAIQQAYAQKTLALESSTASAQMTMMSTAAGDMGTIMAGAFGKSSGIAQAAFAVQKGIAIANAIINIQSGISKAMALGFPANIPVIASTIAQGASIVNTIKGTQIEGQAHSGLDSVPQSHDNSTFLLKAGERVVQPEANRDLTKFLSNTQNGASSEITINSPLILQGGGDISPQKFTQMCKEHADVILQAVRQSQQRNS
ncbi:hypothetical protein H0I54_11695 [Yersinia kristensenii]|uniref:hypothetical protein n=1 Tax=Yersinia kristensenii TaxID=28152 RepID=UPI001C610EDF|nr:hypothetical protein [Yersinia kristensenii]MBW5842476.1 hypothetical protein [Yersinia kristensenii]